MVFTLLCLLAFQLRMIDSAKREIVKLQLDRDEIKQHTDELARIITTQQYQIDVLAGMLEK